MANNNSYSKLLSNDFGGYRKWHNLWISEITQKKRNQIRPLLDNFTSFSWRGVDAWDNFGAFIINEKNSLKFFEGPTWSNQYSQPQFSSQIGQLTGISFKTPQISFTIGVYWFSEKEYRYLLDWLNPYEVSRLSFGFEPKYFYQVKLASISQGTRYVLGHEPQAVVDLIGGEKERYYTELKLTFELQGPMCAYNVDAWEWTPTITSQNSEAQFFDSLTLENEYFNGTKSDLDFPIEANINFILPEEEDETENPYDQTTINLTMTYFSSGTQQTITLFSCTLTNLPYQTGDTINFRYTSEDGLIFWQTDDSRYQLLSSLSTLSTGKRFVKDIISNSVVIPGHFNFHYNGYDRVEFHLTYSGRPIKFNRISKVIGRGRTNSI